MHRCTINEILRAHATLIRDLTAAGAAGSNRMRFSGRRHLRDIRNDKQARIVDYEPFDVRAVLIP